VLINCKERQIRDIGIREYVEAVRAGSQSGLHLNGTQFKEWSMPAIDLAESPDPLRPERLVEKFCIGGNRAHPKP